VYQLEEYNEVVRIANKQSSTVYSWKTLGKDNWLEQGISLIDTLGLIVLPKGLPDVIDMADDIIEE
jgi:hypothetical protein